MLNYSCHKFSGLVGLLVGSVTFRVTLSPLPMCLTDFAEFIGEKTFKASVSLLDRDNIKNC